MLDANNLVKLVGICLGKVIIHPVKLELIWKELKDEFFMNIMEKDYKETELYTIMENLQWDTVLYEQRKLVILCPRGDVDIDNPVLDRFNIDSGDFIWALEDSRGITLKDIVEGIYRMKVNKWEIVQEQLYKLEVVIKQGVVIIRVEFEYKSKT